MTDKPNLHHIFPLNYLAENPGNNNLDANSLMNIAYITNDTNIWIKDKNPRKYIRELAANPKFEGVLSEHLVPKILLNWSRADELPENALDQFIEARINLFVEAIRNKLDGIEFQVVDTHSSEDIPE